MTFISRAINFLKTKLVKARFTNASDLPANFTFSVAKNQHDIEQSFRLIHQCYVDRGIARHQHNGLLCNLFSASPYTIILLAKKDEQVIATVSLIQDSQLGLPSDKKFKKENDELRKKGVKLLEISAMAVDQQYRNKSIGRNINFYLMNYMTRVGEKFLKGEALVAVVNPKIQFFYEGIFDFQQSGGVQSYERANGAPAVHLSTTFVRTKEYMRQTFANKAPNKNHFRFFYEQDIPQFIWPEQIPQQNLQYVHILTEETVKDLFEKKSELFSELEEHDLLQLKQFYELYLDTSEFESMKELRFSLGRKKFRILTKLSVRLSLPNKHERSLLGKIINLSLNGCMIELAQPLGDDAVTREYEVNFTLGQQRLQLIGKIVRLQKENTQKIGFRFTHGLEELKAAIADTLHGHKPKLSKKIAA